MKLFKKLAAAALAAVLALSMVGCGNANSVNPTKQFVLDLLNKAAELYGSKEQNDKSADALLKAASKEDGMGFEAGKTYLVSYAEDHQYKSSLISNTYKQQFLFMNLTQNGFTVQPGSPINTKKTDVGVAVGKIGDKTYAVVVMMPTK